MSILAIGITGSIASGKGAVASLLVEAGFSYFSLSDRVREEATRLGFRSATRENLQRIGNELRGKRGPAVWAQRTLEVIRSVDVVEAAIDGIRNPYEARYLQKHTRFCLVAVDAPAEVRFKRVRERERSGDPDDFEAFLRVDARDRGAGETEEGQQVGACIKIANVSIWNEGSLTDLRAMVAAVLADISREPHNR